MTTKHEIEITGLPEGWRAVAYRFPEVDEHVLYRGVIELCSSPRDGEYLIVEKIKPREKKFIETEECCFKPGESGYCYDEDRDILYFVQSAPPFQTTCKIWREVKE